MTSQPKKCDYPSYSYYAAAMADYMRKLGYTKAADYWDKEAQ